MKLNLPDFVKNVLNTLKKNGYEAFVVGGSIRDIIMGKTPFDFDIATNALPNDVINIFDKTIPTGIKHGTVTVMSNNNAVEVTTYRTDNGYLDSRHPESVSFVSSIEEDLSRRDFTVNAIAYNDEKGIFDPFNGLCDIEKKCLKTVGNPKERFEEDALRILRLFRFSSQLDFRIEKNTLSCALEAAPNLMKISAERIREEFLKILCGKNPMILNTLIKSDALNFLGIKNDAAVSEKINIIPFVYSIRLSYFCLVNNIDIVKICNYFKTSKAFMDECSCISDLYKLTVPISKNDIKRILTHTKLEYFKKYSLLYDSLNKSGISPLLSEIIKNNEPYNIKMLLVSGDDLINHGYSGKEIGEKLNYLLNIVIDNPEMNSKDKLLSLL